MSSFLPLRFAAPDEVASAPPLGDPSRVHVWRTERAEPIAYGFADNDSNWMYWPSLATFRFVRHDRFITVYPEPGARDEVICDVYRRGVLPMALQALGHEALHASAVVGPAGVVAFAARSGTGKSTIAYGLSRLGYQQWADDSVVFQMIDGRAEATALPFQVRLRRPESVALFGSVAPEIDVNAPATPASWAAESLTAICVLDRLVQKGADGPIKIRHLPPSEAFLAVLAHAHVFAPSDLEPRKRALEVYLDLAAHVPVFEVAFQAGREHAAALLDAIIDAVHLQRAGRPVSLSH